MSNRKKLFRYLTIVSLFLVLVISLPTLCGCRSVVASLFYNLFKPRPGTISDPETFLKEECGIVLPSDARLDYNYYVSYPKVGEYGYFLACYYPETPKELIAYVGQFEELSITDKEKSQNIRCMERVLKDILRDGGKSVDDLDDNLKPDWDSEFITDWKKFDGPPYHYRFEVYFPVTQRLLVWGSVYEL